ncbi:MAG: SLC13 family permease [Alphaproteobacteria bacterium]|nr:SLC13 family permease [Alphaproteobacteria bacterium]
MIRRALIAAVMTVAAALLVLAPVLSGSVGGADPVVLRAVGVLLFAIGSWALAALPEFITAIVFFLVAMVFQIAPASTVFSGFASTAWWLVFGGLVAGIAIDMTGLGRRLARAIDNRLTRSYLGILAGLALVAVALAFLMPSTMGRVVLMMPIVLALADRLDFAQGSKGRAGLVMTAMLATFVPSTGILPANVPNMVLLGAAEALYGIKFTYGPYLLLHFPIVGVLYLAMLVPVVAYLLPDRPRAMPSQPPAVPMSHEERKLAWILGAALALFALDVWHGVSPAWVSLAAGLVCLLPGIGLVSAKAFSERMNLAVLVYVAGIIGAGALISESGLGNRLGTVLIEVLRPTPGADLWNFAAYAGAFVLTGLITTMVAQPAVLTPMAERLAEAAGLPVATVLMMEVLGFASVLLPYQSPPLVVGLQLGGVAWRDGARVCLIMGGLTVAILLPIAYVWWRFLGWIGAG